MSKDRIYTTAAAAAEIGCDGSTIRRWCARLGVARLGRDWLITDEVLAQLRGRISPGAPGNPQFAERAAALGRKGGKKSQRVQRKRRRKQEAG